VFAGLRGLDAGVPLLAMTYYNLVFHMGDERFAGEMAEAGFSGMILPDVPMEEQGPWRAAADRPASRRCCWPAPSRPTTGCRRVRAEPGLRLRREPHGHHRRAGVAGRQAATLAGRLKAATDKPVLMGFGVSTPEQAVEVAAPADGVIVGTALVRRILDGGGPEEAHRFVASLRQALDES
jgi:tryptophan synthase alpha chain